MTQTRLLEIIVYTKGLRDAAHDRITRHKNDKWYQAQAIGSCTSLSDILSILRKEVTTYTNV
jgi:hypothetical protein